MRDDAYLTVRQMREELATLRADLARVTEERQRLAEKADLWQDMATKAARQEAAALAAERERCAKVCEAARFTMGADPIGTTILATVAAAIRAQPTPTTEARDA